MVASQRDDQRRSQVPARVEQGNLRRRAGTEDLSVSGSARLRLPAQVNVGSLAELHRRDFINQSPRHQLGDLQVKHEAKEKECRAPMVSRRCHNSSRSNEARLPQLIMGRDRGSRKVGRKDNQNKRHRQGSNNFVAITAAAPEREQTNHNRIEVFLCDGLGFRPHLLLNVFPPAYSLGDVT
jgi:hypothetical protein